MTGWEVREGNRYVAGVLTRTLSLVVTAALVLVACGSDDDATPTTEAAPETVPPATDAPTTTEPALEDLELIGPGAYDVGVQTITIDAGSDRPLTVDVWFPLDDAGDAPLHRYTFLPEIYYESPTAVTADAAQISADGPFPLVVYSHGSGGLRYIASDYTEAIASHGYVVAAADHTGNTAVELVLDIEGDRAANAFNRPNDVVAVIDAMTDPQSTETVGFSQSVDPEQIAVTGHSAGGYTAYAVAGGVETDLGPVEADPRVDAIITLAPSSSGITDEAFAAMTVPALVMAGTADDATPIDPNVTRPWELAASAPHHRADLVDAGHQSFSIACEAQAFLPTLPTPVPPELLELLDSYAEQGCGDGLMDIERAKALTNTFAISFLESVFRSGDMIDTETTEIPDDVLFQSR